MAFEFVHFGPTAVCLSKTKNCDVQLPHMFDELEAFVWTTVGNAFDIPSGNPATLHRPALVSYSPTRALPEKRMRRPDP